MNNEQNKPDLNNDKGLKPGDVNFNFWGQIIAQIAKNGGKTLAGVFGMG